MVQLVDEITGRVLYTIRSVGPEFRPPVYSRGPFTVRVGEPDTERWVEIESLIANVDGSAQPIDVRLPPQSSAEHTPSR